MDYRSLQTKTIVELKAIAKDENIKLPARATKAVLVETIGAHLQEKAAQTTSKAATQAEPAKKSARSETKPHAETKTRVETKPHVETKPRTETNKQVEKPQTEAKTRMEEKPRSDTAEKAQPHTVRRTTPKAEVKPLEKPTGTMPEKKAEAPIVSEKEAGAKVTEPEKREEKPVRETRTVEPAAPSHEFKPAQTANAERKMEAPTREFKPALAANTERKAEPPQQAQPSRPFQRPLSTQQRMGARTQPVQNSYRKPQQGGVPGRFNTESNLSRPQRSFDPAAQNRRPMADAQRIPPQNAENAPRRAPINEDLPYDDERLLNPGVPELLSGGDCGDGAGILEIHPEGYGFLRAENYLPGNRDVYVSAAQIRRFNLRTGDYVVGKTRPQQAGDRSVGLIFISEINGQTPDMARGRKPFDSLVPVYPDERLRMERADKKDYSLRLIDVIAPIGKGQRGMIVSPPKAGKTTLLKKVANAIVANNPEVHLIVLLIDERPEEVTDMKRSIQGEVVYSTFDEAPENHTRVSEMVLERAQRLVELGKDVVILLDSITRLARAYNLVIPPTGRSLSGGLDPGALYRPKRFFGAARNIEGGGSLTIIATALVDTGSRMDDIIFEEFKGTGNMELHLDRSLSDRRIFPAIDMYKSGTRREELLLTKEELDGCYQVRRMLSKGSPQETAEQLIMFMEKTGTNTEFFQKVRGWMTAFEKEGFGKRR